MDQPRHCLMSKRREAIETSTVAVVVSVCRNWKEVMAQVTLVPSTAAGCTDYQSATRAHAAVGTVVVGTDKAVAVGQDDQR
jgi:uncharacterized protein (UPF0264 family)